MGLFFVDQRQFKQEMHGLVDAGHTDDFRARVEDTVARHGIAITAKEYSRQVDILVRSRNQDRARKLVDCIGDVGLSRTGGATVWLVRKGFRLGLLAAFVVLVMWLYGMMN